MATLRREPGFPVRDIVGELRLDGENDCSKEFRRMRLAVQCRRLSSVCENYMMAEGGTGKSRSGMATGLGWPLVAERSFHHPGLAMSATGGIRYRSGT